MFFFHHSYTVEESGLLKGFTDCHCHLLPGVDDGMQQSDQSLRLLDRMEQVGVARVNFTPHIMEDIPNTTQDLRQHLSDFMKLYHGGMRITLAAENMLDSLFCERLEKGDLLALDNRRLLVETSYYNPPYGMDGMLTDILSRDLTPVLAHPERYVYMGEDDYEKLKNMQILFQLNLPSLTGAYGQHVKEKALMILGRGWYDLCGTDTHSIRFYEAFLKGKLNNKTINQVREVIAKTPNQ